MGRNTGGYEVNEGDSGWIKAALGRVRERISEVRRAVFEFAAEAVARDTALGARIDQSGTAVGAIRLFPIGAVPANWLVCDGALVSRSIYAALFAATGTTFGAGNGSTTFALPDMNSLDTVNRLANPRITSLVDWNVTGNCNAATDGVFPGTQEDGLVGYNGIQLTAPTSSDSYIERSGPPAGLAMKPGGTYVWSMTGSVRSAVGGTELTGRSRRLVVLVSTNNGGSYTETASAQITSTVETGGLVLANEKRVSIEFTLPAGATNVLLRAYLGHTQGAITWTFPTIVEKPANAPSWAKLTERIDGAKQATRWASYHWVLGQDFSISRRVATNPAGTVYAIRAT